MPVMEMTDLRQAIPKGKRLLGLDLGKKTIGLAISDGAWMLASPVTTIRRKKFTEDAAQLFALCAERDVGGLVIGLPMNMDGSEGPRVNATREFTRILLQKQDMPAAFWDERLSTAAVERRMIEEADLSRKKRVQVIDQAAAAYILQGALDFLAQQPQAGRQ
ncbi:MAG: Holliday junction resolvase RuvX [Alphaproteobacteria bacterium]|nr:Holliday junction resolvase RuvX [Alphaproteobacteria bacterium]